MTEQNPILPGAGITPAPQDAAQPDTAPKPDIIPGLDAVTAPTFAAPPAGVLPSIPESFTRSQKLLGLLCPFAAFGILRYMILHALGLPATLVCWGVLTLGILFLKRTPRIRFTWSHRCMAAVLYLFPLLFCISDNQTMTCLCGVYVLLGMPFFFFYVASGDRELPRFLPLALHKALLDYPWQNKLMFPAIRSCLRQRKLSRNALYVFVGLLLGIPLTLLVYALLLSTDGNMRFLTDWIQEDWYRGLMIRLLQFLCALPIGMFLYNSLYNNATRRNIRSLRLSDCEETVKALRIAPGTLLYTIMTPVCFVYAVYIGLQASYLFSGFAGTLPEGFSYAGYARSGFFELCFLSVLNFLLIAMLYLMCRREGQDRPLALRIYSSLLCVITLLLIATAESKMLLYISQMGLTQKRVYTAWFMLFLGLVFLMLLLRQFRPWFHLARGVLVTGTLMLGLLAFSRPDAWIAAYNLEAYKAGKLPQLSASDFYDLSDDAYMLFPENQGLLEEMGSEHAYRSAMKKQWQKDVKDQFRQYNLSTWRFMRRYVPDNGEL